MPGASDPNDVLPSLRFRGDDPRPVGFVQELTTAHVEGAAAALSELASSFDTRRNADLHLEVCLCCARYVPALPFQLYSFHVVSFDEHGGPVDEVAVGEEILYAFVVNHPVEVQREAALLFLYDLVFRQVALHRPGVDANQADIVATEATERARAEFRDRMRFGWRTAARALGDIARHEGIALEVRHRLDPFPEREALVRRMAALRETYNSIDIAREFIDKVVSLVGGRDPRVSAPGAPEEMRLLAERRLVEMGLRHYMTQTLRDAEVLGNGYLVMPTSPDVGPYNLRPEEVVVGADGSFTIQAEGRSEVVRAPVLHDRGVEQFTSPYGFSVLEAVLPEWVTRQSMQDIAARTRTLVDDLGGTAEHRDYLKNVEELVDRHRQASDERLAKLLWYPRNWVPEAARGLYFPGQERM